MKGMKDIRLSAELALSMVEYSLIFFVFKFSFFAEPAT